MIYALRFLVVLLIIETVACGYFASKQLFRAIPSIPISGIDDPLLPGEIKELVSHVETGTDLEWQKLGEALMSQGFYGHAELNFIEALKLNSENTPAQFGLGFCLDKMGRTKQSTEEYRKFLAIQSEEPDKQNMNFYAMYSIGKNYLREENAQQAEATFNDIQNFAPADYQLAKLFIRSNRAEQALEIIEKNLAEIPRSLEFHYLNHVALNSLGRFEEAQAAADMIERSEHLVSLNFNSDYLTPFNYQYGLARIFNLCDMYQNRNNLGEFEKNMKLILEAMGDRRLRKYPTALYQMMMVAFQREDADRMLHFLDKMDQAEVVSSQTLYFKGKAYALKDQWDQAEVYWQRSLRMFPNAQVHHDLADYYRQKELTEKENYHVAKEKLLTGIFLYRQNQLKQAMTELQAATSVSPDDPWTWFYLGEVNRVLDNDDQAEQAYLRCLQISPYHGRALMRTKSKKGAL